MPGEVNLLPGLPPSPADRYRNGADPKEAKGLPMELDVEKAPLVQGTGKGKDTTLEFDLVLKGSPEFWSKSELERVSPVLGCAGVRI